MHKIFQRKKQVTNAWPAHATCFWYHLSY